MGVQAFLRSVVAAAMCIAAAVANAGEGPPLSDNATCLACHGNEGFAMPGPDGKPRALHVAADRFGKSTHGPLPCIACHQDITDIPHKAGVARKVECANCHAAPAQQYLASVHAAERAKGNLSAPSCATCHTAHEVRSPKGEAEKIAIVQRCGSCHKENLSTYSDTYHGQVTTLGYAHTAKCFNCHAAHDIKRVADPTSTVHPNNRLETCRKCHAGATAGFVTFRPHANTHDFERYPQMWITSKFMIALLVGVFAFFWTHSTLWFYREFKDRKEGKTTPHVATADLPRVQGKHVRRFGALWRLAHLVFALSVMALVLTGMSVFYAETAWAKAIMQALGGPRTAGLIHRTSAVLMLGIFAMHLIVVAAGIWRRRKTFRWFGPESFVPNWKDLADATAMFKWFFGQGPRPVFDRWTYWEKFDYWAVFWGMAIIGGSGFMLWFPNLIATVLPGWVFNVATLVHGEEAFLAAVFLFTVHFFNNHFRPDKYPPPDIVMFTGTVPLEHFKREHTLEYKRMVATGELQKYLVDAPSRQMTVGSRILGLTLIGFGLVLLALVLIGFVGGLRGVV